MRYDGQRYFKYDAANRLASVCDNWLNGTCQGTETKYTYTGDGQRIGQEVINHSSGTSVTTKTETYLLDVGHPQAAVLKTTTEEGVVETETEYLYGLGLLAQSHSSDGVEYFAQDADGSPRQGIDPEGRVVMGQTFDPYGSPISHAEIAPIPTPYGYVGGLTDQTGLVTLNGRPYDPATGLHYDNPYGYGFDYSPFVNLHIDPKHVGPMPFNLFDGQWATGVSNAHRLSHDPRATPFQKAYSGAYVGASYTASAALIIGGGYLLWEAPATISTISNWSLRAGVTITTRLGGALNALILADALDDTATFMLGVLGSRAHKEQAAMLVSTDPFDGPNTLMGFMWGMKYARLGVKLAPDDLVGGSGARHWTDELLISRSIKKPQDIEALEALSILRRQLLDDPKIAYRIDSETELDIDTLAILEVGDKWYLGVNSQLDQQIYRRYHRFGGIKPVRDRLQGRLTGFNRHAETSAIAEYWLRGGGPDSYASLYVTRQPCSSCVYNIPDQPAAPPYPGEINQIIFFSNQTSKTSFNQIEVIWIFRQDDSLIGPIYVSPTDPRR